MRIQSEHSVRILPVRATNAAPLMSFTKEEKMQSEFTIDDYNGTVKGTPDKPNGTLAVKRDLTSIEHATAVLESIAKAEEEREASIKALLKEREAYRTEAESRISKMTQMLKALGWSPRGPKPKAEETVPVETETGPIAHVAPVGARNRKPKETPAS